jgi:hypothetical protein
MREFVVTLRNADKEPPKGRLDRAQQIAQVFSLFALPLLVAAGGWWIQRSIARADLEQKYVELALSVLREPLKDSNKSLRHWSTETLARYSKIPFSADDLRNLADGSVVLPSGYVITQKNPNGTFVTKTYDATGSLVEESRGVDLGFMSGSSGHTYKPGESPEKLEIKPRPK